MHYSQILRCIFMLKVIKKVVNFQVDGKKKNETNGTEEALFLDVCHADAVDKG